MKTYIKPIFCPTEQLLEGIYMNGSGIPQNDNCWMLESYVSQRNRDLYDPFVNFRIRGVHQGVEHISTALEIIITFTDEVKAASFEYDGFSCEVKGYTVILKRINHANAYNNMDIFDSNLKVKTLRPDNINIINMTWTCTKEPNVHGKI